MKTPEEWQARLSLLIKLGRVTSNEVYLFQAAMLEAWEAGWVACRNHIAPSLGDLEPPQPPPELTKKGTPDE